MSSGVHRIQSQEQGNVVAGDVAWEPVRSLWISTHALAAIIGGALTFTWTAFAIFVFSTSTVLLLGHSLGMHRKLIHDAFACPKWLEYFLVYCGVLVGLAGPLGLLRTHDLRDHAQRQRHCHDFLAHRRRWWIDAWWQLHCDLRLHRPPAIVIEDRIAGDRFYRFLQRTWMLQQLPWALLLFAIGGWGFVFWGVCARVCAGVGGHWAVGYFAHNRGDMHHLVRGACVQGHNVRFVSLLTMGESWHNNHHAFPGSAKLGLQPGEWDPGWWCLRTLRAVGLAWDLCEPADLPPRPELIAVSTDTFPHLSASTSTP